MGPAIEYRDYHDFINLKGNYAKMKPGSHLKPGFIRFGQTLLMLVAYFALTAFVKKSDLLTEEFASKPFALKAI